MNGMGEKKAKGEKSNWLTREKQQRETHTEKQGKQNNQRNDVSVVEQMDHCCVSVVASVCEKRVKKSGFIKWLSNNKVILVNIMTQR